MRDETADLFELFRRMAGVVPDDELRFIRYRLAIGYGEEAKWDLVCTLRESGNGLDPDEPALARVFDRIDLEDPVTDWIPLSTAPWPSYRFEPAESSADDAELLRSAAADSTARKVVKAQRFPASSTAIQVERIVYVVEFAEGADLVDLQGLFWPRVSGVCFEAVVEGEYLPLYQAEALAAGRTIWRRGTGETHV